MSEKVIKIPFKVSARAGKLLGRENFSNPEGAIIELVKNAYDADAENCIVLFDIPIIEKKDENGISYVVPDRENSIIYIIDNGEGMERGIVEEYWMQIGTGNKEQFHLSGKKRVKTGAKGIGRFALDRLGLNTKMWTLSKNSENGEGLFWEMNWNQFDDFTKVISEIEADLILQPINLKDKIRKLAPWITNLEKIDLNNFNHGTILMVSNLKDEWYNDAINNVFSSLEALIPPKELNIPFQVYFKHFQEPSVYGIVNTAFFNDYDYKIHSKYNSETLMVELVIERNELDLNRLNKNFNHLFESLSPPFDLNTINNKIHTYTKSVDKMLNWKLNEAKKDLLKSIGDFQFSFNFIKLANSRKEGYPYKDIIPKERRSTLERFGGIKIYRDSFRVRPYGDPQNDWLGLGFRAAKSPAGAGQRIGDWRVNNESIAGIITISRKANELLQDKSDRGGLQENDVFEAFKNIIIGIIHEFEIDRSRILNPIYLFNQQEKKRKQIEEIQKQAEILARKIIEEQKNNPILDEEEEHTRVENIFKDSVRTILEEKREDENREIVQIRSLASLGLIVSSFSHELKEVSNNASEIEALEKYALYLIPSDKRTTSEYLDVIDIFELLKDDKEKIKHWVDYTLTAIRKDKRTRTQLDFSNFFQQLKKSWMKIFKRKDVNLSIKDGLADTKYDFRAFEMDMTTIFSNLINNSIDSFEQRTSIDERNIEIDVAIIDNKIEIKFSDNGRGLDQSFENKEDIFLPFTTSKRDRTGNEIGTGLGMYLVKSVIDDNNGNIEVMEPKVGFAVKITFSLLNK